MNLLTLIMFVGAQIIKNVEDFDVINITKNHWTLL